MGVCTHEHRYSARLCLAHNSRCLAIREKCIGKSVMSGAAPVGNSVQPNQVAFDANTGKPNPGDKFGITPDPGNAFGQTQSERAEFDAARLQGASSKESPFRTLQQQYRQNNPDIAGPLPRANVTQKNSDPAKVSTGEQVTVEAEALRAGYTSIPVDITGVSLPQATNSVRAVGLNINIPKQGSDTRTPNTIAGNPGANLRIISSNNNLTLGGFNPNTNANLIPRERGNLGFPSSDPNALNPRPGFVTGIGTVSGTLYESANSKVTGFAYAGARQFENPRIGFNALGGAGVDVKFSNGVRMGFDGVGFGNGAARRNELGYTEIGGYIGKGDTTLTVRSSNTYFGGSQSSDMAYQLDTKLFGIDMTIDHKVFDGQKTNSGIYFGGSW
jgi:hypothetical protein